MAGNDTLDDGESDAGSLKFLNGMQALEHTEQLVGIPHVETGTIVSNKVYDFVVIDGAADLNYSGLPETAELDGIGQQVDEYLMHHGKITCCRRNSFDFHLQLAVGYSRLEFFDNFVYQFFHVNV